MSHAHILAIASTFGLPAYRSILEGAYASLGIGVGTDVSLLQALRLGACHGVHGVSPPKGWPDQARVSRGGPFFCVYPQRLAMLHAT